MPGAFHINTQVHEDSRLIVFTIKGEIDSAALIQDWMKTFSALDRPWRYDRLYDYRRSEGLVDFDELTRFAKWWSDLTQGIEYACKIAVIVNNPLDQIRVNLVAKLFPYEERQAFESRGDAMRWLEDSVAKDRQTA